MRALDYDVTLRNKEMNKRDRYTYGEGLWETIKIPNGFDKTLYNFFPRIIDIHSSQLMGRPFQIYSYYNKDDISIYPNESPEQKDAENQNKLKKEAADSRKRIVDAIIRENGGYKIFKDGARIGSLYGTTIYKGWWDADTNNFRIQLLESPQNYRAMWSDSNFRDRDGDAYVYQITPSKAYRLYGSTLPAGQAFATATETNPWGATEGGSNTADPIDQSTNTTLPIQTQIPMVTVVDFTGYMPGWKLENDVISRCDYGKENEISVLIVGRQVVQKISDPFLLPEYWVINNRQVPRRAWGESDISESALQTHATLLERMSDYITLTNKSLFPLLLAKGFDPAALPKKKQREMAVVAAELDQSIEAVNMPTAFGYDYEKLIDRLLDFLVRETGVGRVLFDDPTINPSSNQALMTTLKGVIDIVEDKQSRWEPVLADMFQKALEKAAHFDKKIAASIASDDNWYLYTRWPSVLRREDATYQQMWLNRFNSNTVSLDTYLEAMGTEDVSEEKDRIRDNMKDPVSAAILGKQLSELAHFTIFQSLGIPLYGFNQPKITLRGDLTPQQEGNLAQNQGFNDGPFGASVGPQGREGEYADQNVINQGFVQGGTQPYAKYGMPTGVTPGQPIHPATPGAGQGAPGAPAPQAANPQLTSDQNTGQTASMPGSGATAVSAQGAINQHHQRKGK